MRIGDDSNSHQRLSAPISGEQEFQNCFSFAAFASFAVNRFGNCKLLIANCSYNPASIRDLGSI